MAEGAAGTVLPFSALLLVFTEGRVRRQRNPPHICAADNILPQLIYVNISPAATVQLAGAHGGGMEADGLARARARIDEIDDLLLGLLRQRAEIVDEVAHAKRRAGEERRSAFRPEREAAVLRRLHRQAEEAGGPSFEGIARVWREIMAAALIQQEPVAVGLPLLEGSRALEMQALARNHFGGGAKLTEHPDMADLFWAVSRRPSLLGVVPDLASYAEAARETGPIRPSATAEPADASAGGESVGTDESDRERANAGDRMQAGAKDDRESAAPAEVFESSSAIEESGATDDGGCRIFAALPFWGASTPLAYAFGHVRLAPTGDDVTVLWCGDEPVKGTEALPPVQAAGGRIVSLAGFIDPATLPESVKLLGCYARPLDMDLP